MCASRTVMGGSGSAVAAYEELRCRVVIGGLRFTPIHDLLAEVHFMLSPSVRCRMRMEGLPICDWGTLAKQTLRAKGRNPWS